MRKRRGSYTLDQLLRFKRSEQPDDAFWGEFDRKLRRKQRLLLQEQSIEDIDLDAAPWTRMRKLATALTAVAACWTLTFVALNIEKAPSPETTTASDTLAVVSNPEAATSTSDTGEIASHSDASPFLEVTTPIELIEAGSSSNERLLASNQLDENRNPNRRYFLQASYTLELNTIMEPVDFEGAIAFNADESVKRTILEKYTHPLSDRGWRYDQYVANQPDPLNRITAAAFDLELFDRETRRERKLNKLTLKF